VFNVLKIVASNVRKNYDFLLQFIDFIKYSMHRLFYGSLIPSAWKLWMTGASYTVQQCDQSISVGSSEING